jgi:hypothetical protein
MGLFSGIGSAIGGVLGGPVGAAVVGGGAQLLGGILTNSANSAQASKNRDFQAGMSNSAYQRSMADMRAAGLNPILAYQQGGASTPSGAQAHLTNPAEGLLNSALSTKRLEADLSNLAETNKNIKADTRLKNEQVQATRELAKAHTNSARKLKADAQISEANLPGAEVEASIDNSAYGKALRFINRGTDSLGNAIGAFGNIFSGQKRKR